MKNYHKSVLLQETLDALNIKAGERYIDGTLGGGGHTSEILELGGIILGIDQDKDAIMHVSNSLKNPNLILSRGNFKNIDELAAEFNFKDVS